MYTNYLSWLLLAPILLSLAAFSARWAGKLAMRVAEVLHFITILVVLILGLLVIQGVLVEGSVVALNDWLHVDALAAVFLLIVCVVGFLVGIYSIGYIRNDVRTGELQADQVSTYYGLFDLFLFTMVLVVTANNIIMMWVAIEATTLGSTFLVGIYGHRSSLEAAWKYVIICTVGVAFALYGTVLVYSDAVNFLQRPEAAVLWTEIVKNARALDPTLLKLAFVFILIGFGTKAGIFPMHAWLPDAHSEAPSPVSALLSGVLLNCALLVIIRFAIILEQGIGPEFPQMIFLIFGSLSVVAAALFIFVQRDIKRLLAYSSVENIGLIVLAFGIGGPAGILAALLHTINHSLVKALMFCTSGNILVKYHTRDLSKIKGMLQVAPFTSFVLLVGTLALIGSPPFNIFISKFSIFSAGFFSGFPLLMVVLLLFLAIVFAAFMKMASSAVFGSLPENITKGDVRISMLAPIAVLVILVLALGLYLPPQISMLLNQAALISIHGNAAADASISLLNFSNSELPIAFLQFAQLFGR
ncbi:MAG: hydrogenase [Anaerolineae bacterium UTCFX2]|jgi:hydrogenase-4 component F|nr:hydrogenase 4 subunit F [Anaerolineales bacterium]OQY87970.1 MAG: hydrogenase [Anaerolineae bacterium UTCFX2]